MCVRAPVHPRDSRARRCGRRRRRPFTPRVKRTDVTNRLFRATLSLGILNRAAFTRLSVPLFILSAALPVLWLLKFSCFHSAQGNLEKLTNCSSTSYDTRRGTARGMGTRHGCTMVPAAGQAAAGGDQWSGAGSLRQYGEPDVSRRLAGRLAKHGARSPRRSRLPVARTEGGGEQGLSRQGPARPD